MEIDAAMGIQRNNNVLQTQLDTLEGQTDQPEEKFNRDQKELEGKFSNEKRVLKTAKRKISNDISAL